MPHVRANCILCAVCGGACVHVCMCVCLHVIAKIARTLSAHAHFHTLFRTHAASIKLLKEHYKSNRKKKCYKPFPCTSIRVHFHYFEKNEQMNIKIGNLSHMEAFTICIYKTTRLRVMRPMNKEKYEQKKKHHINPTEAYSFRERCTGWKKPYKCDLRAYIYIWVENGQHSWIEKNIHEHDCHGIRRSWLECETFYDAWLLNHAS